MLTCECLDKGAMKKIIIRNEDIRTNLWLIPIEDKIRKKPLKSRIVWQQWQWMNYVLLKLCLLVPLKDILITSSIESRAS